MSRGDCDSAFRYQGGRNGSDFCTHKNTSVQFAVDHPSDLPTPTPTPTPTQAVTCGGAHTSLVDSQRRRDVGMLFRRHTGKAATNQLKTDRRQATGKQTTTHDANNDSRWTTSTVDGRQQQRLRQLIRNIITNTNDHHTCK